MHTLRDHDAMQLAQVGDHGQVYTSASENSYVIVSKCMPASMNSCVMSNSFLVWLKCSWAKDKPAGLLTPPLYIVFVWHNGELKSPFLQ